MSEDNMTWEERFPEEAEHNKRCEQGIPYIEVEFWKNGSVGSVRIPYGHYNEKTANNIIKQRIKEEIDELSWYFTVWHLNKGWTFDRYESLNDALGGLKERKDELFIKKEFTTNDKIKNKITDLKNEKESLVKPYKHYTWGGSWTAFRDMTREEVKEYKKIESQIEILESLLE